MSKSILPLYPLNLAAVLLGCAIQLAAEPARALLSDAAAPWSLVDNGGSPEEENNWLPYTVGGIAVRDPEGGKSSDLSNGGTSFSGATDISSGWSGINNNCHPDSANPLSPNPGQCGLETSAFYYIHPGDDLGSTVDDTLFLRVRVDGDPQASSGFGFIQNHWNFLFDGDLDNFKELWLDLDGNGFDGTSLGIDKIRIIYENLDSNDVSNEDGAGTAGDTCNGAGNATTDGSGVVVDSFIACHSAGLLACSCPALAVFNASLCPIGGGDPGDHSHSRIVPVNDGTSEYYVDIQVPVFSLRDNTGCYTHPDKLSDTELYEMGAYLVDELPQQDTFRLFYSHQQLGV